MIATPNASDAIVVDAGNVYWTAQDRLSKAPFGGAVVTDLVASYLSTGSWGLTVDASFAYWAEPTLGLQKIPLDGGVSTKLFAPVLHTSFAIRVDATSIYLTADDMIQKLPLTGGAPTVLASTQDDPRALALDATTVYWTNTGLNNAVGSVMQIAKTGGAPTTLATGLSVPSGIAVDATDVYWVNTTAGTVMRVPKGGGPSKILVSGQVGAHDIAVDGNAVYWAVWGNIHAVMKLAK